MIIQMVGIPVGQINFHISHVNFCHLVKIQQNLVMNFQKCVKNSQLCRKCSLLCVTKARECSSMNWADYYMNPRSRSSTANLPLILLWANVDALLLYKAES